MALTTFYTGRDGINRSVTPMAIPPRQHITDPAGYLADEGLKDAVNVALYLGQPLLLTGEPGAGKTQAAYNVAWNLGMGQPLTFETKSTSVSKDLFYTYDALGHYRVQNADRDVALDFIEFQALGRAILLAGTPEARARFLRSDEPGESRRSVVLIDELDKAPRDFPNDLLNEIEHTYFRIPELRNELVEAKPDFHPIVIVTSNSEKGLPEAFLRRCVNYDLAFPNSDELARIVDARLGELEVSNRELLGPALDLLNELRNPSAGLVKKPSTGEFLAWLRIIDQYSPDGGTWRTSYEALEPTLTVLVKMQDDIPVARDVAKRWVDGQKK